MIRNEATQAQVDAADPGNSTWLGANAGSGKTRVLTDRVARLLLDGVLPEHILCLTYTKAAATEMQNRLFRRLGEWAMLETSALRAALLDLGVERDLPDAFLQEARTLFARAIEAPGGLRIQTIHSFCAALLRRFPLEAGVSPQFKEMEDRASELLREEILDRMSDGSQAGLVAGIAPYVSGDDTAGLMAAITGQRSAFAEPLNETALRAAYGLPDGLDEASLPRTVFLGSEAALIAGLMPYLQAGKPTDQKLAARLALVDGADVTALTALEAAVLTQAGTVSKRLFTKDVALAAPELITQLEQLAARVEDARGQRLALAAMRKDAALYAFAGAFLPAYETEKQRRGLLDFDDLIERSRALLSDPRVAEWVLYRLDGGIDHILVDEAQDTSPAQWQVIERLAQEFTAGEGARADVRRTIFVVGDKKQSIYSFQGADPSEFDRMRDEFRSRLQATDAPLVRAGLRHSFRSSPAVLRLVDNCFPDAEEAGFTAEEQHVAFHETMPGRVDLWPLVETTKEDEDGAWYDPVDRRGTLHHTVVLAQRVAGFIRDTIRAGTTLPQSHTEGVWQGRPVHAGDFLILVRGRSRLFEEIIRACKQAGLPIAGADRLKVMAELAVRDIIALLSFLATAEDDLSLATALRSPLFGLTEQQLFTLAHGREGTLWQALRGSDHTQVLATLTDLRNQTDFLRPYDLIDRILTRHNGRRLLLGRLGAEAEDGINALLSQALSYEQSDVPSLTGFLQWAQSDDLQIKRAPDGAGRQLRVMTVHGSKGLEAPIVILPDCAQPNETLRGALLRDDQGALWKQRSDEMPPRQRAAVDLAKAREARERDRLLYVALTRAEKWLVVAAQDDLGKNGTSWYEKVRRGLGGSGPETRLFEFGEWGAGEGLRLTHGDWPANGAPDAGEAAKPPPDLPAYIAAPAVTPPRPGGTLSPSELGGVKALAGPEGDPEDLAKARGTALHLLLEKLPALPEALQEAKAPLLLDTLDEDARALLDPLKGDLIQEALRVLQAPDLAHVFAPGTLAEVPVSADLPGLGRIHGIIDRLVVTPDSVLAVDFKSNRVAPETPDQIPEAILRQLGAYHAALAQIYPDRAISTAVIWTRSAQLMLLREPDVTQALGRVTAS